MTGEDHELVTAALDDEDVVANSSHLIAGDQLGRYVILAEIGRGAMGEVYSAYDPELDRRVAIKLLRRSSWRGAKALTREAQAMAKLTHPHVVAVHDVGAVITTDGTRRLFVAMEYVAGGTLRNWWNEAPRTWEQVVDKFIQAGRGLAAAHAAGFVHRDFKPDNVLVGEDGRVRVTDFGLARTAYELIAAARTETDPNQRRSSAETGERERKPDPVAEELGFAPASRWFGTPAYMAPEQYRGGVIDHLTDQFGFCVALFEGLYGVRPFSGATAGEVAEQICRGEMLAPLADVEVPAWVVEVVLRGLSNSRLDRFPDMNALLSALEPQARSNLRRPLLWVMPVLALFAAVLYVDHRSRDQPAPDPCAGVGDEIHELWSPEVRLGLSETIGATGAPGAGDTATRVLALVDDYVLSWRGAKRRSCEERGAATDTTELYARRVSCLAEAKREFAGHLEAFRTIEASQVTNLVATFLNLPELGECEDLETLARRRPPPEPAIAVKVEAFAQRLDRVEALKASGAYDRARSTLDPVDVALHRLAYRPLLARRAALSGELAKEQHHGERALSELRQAWFESLAIGDDLLALSIAASLVQVLGTDLQQPEQALEWALHGRALAERVDRPEALAKLLSAEGMLAYRSGELDRAIELMAEAHRLYLAVVGPEHIYTGRAANNLAAVLLAAHRYEEALEYHHRAFRVFEVELGPLHSYNVTTRLNYGLTLMNMQREDEARLALEAALALLDRRAQASDAYLYGLVHNGLGDLDARATDWTGALEHFTRMHAQFSELFGEQNGYTANALTALASAELRLGKVDEAVAKLERALIVQQQLTAPAEELANTQAELAIALWTQAQARDRAQELFAAALEVFDGETLALPATTDAWLAQHPEILNGASG